MYHLTSPGGEIDVDTFETALEYMKLGRNIELSYEQLEKIIQHYKGL